MMIRARTFHRLKIVAMTACSLMAGTVFAATCTMTDIRDNMVAGSLTAVKNYVTGFWGTLIPDLKDAITVAQANGVAIPNPPWP
jgi:hypothetical protein